MCCKEVTIGKLLSEQNSRAPTGQIVLQADLTCHQNDSQKKVCARIPRRIVGVSVLPKTLLFALLPHGHSCQGLWQHERLTSALTASAILTRSRSWQIKLLDPDL